MRAASTSRVKRTRNSWSSASSVRTVLIATRRPDAEPDFGRAPVTEVFAPEMPPHLLVHFAVTELEPALETVTRLGGRTQVPPFETSYGTAAVVTDNQGASFALLRR